MKAFVSGETAAIPRQVAESEAPGSAPGYAIQQASGFLPRQNADHAKSKQQANPASSPGKQKAFHGKLANEPDALSSQRAVHRNPSFSAVNIPCNLTE